MDTLLWTQTDGDFGIELIYDPNEETDKIYLHTKPAGGWLTIDELIHLTAWVHRWAQGQAERIAVQAAATPREETP